MLKMYVWSYTVSFDLNRLVEGWDYVVNTALRRRARHDDSSSRNRGDPTSSYPNQHNQSNKDPSSSIILTLYESPELFVVKFNGWDLEDDEPTASPTKSPVKDPTYPPTDSPTVSQTKTPTTTSTKGPTLAPSQCPGGKSLLVVEYMADNKCNKEDSLVIKQWNAKKNKFKKKNELKRIKLST